MRRTIGLGTLCALALAAPSTAQGAELLYGVTQNNRVVQFTSDAPGNVFRNLPITGLQSGENVVGIDVRPVNGALYALGSTSRLYLVNPDTGGARAVGAPFATPLNGTQFGFDFNPQVDRIRIVSDTDQNLRVNPDTGAVQTVDGPLAYAAGDPGAGANPNVAASAYTNSVPGATSTELFGIDADRDTLVLQNPPNDGVLTTRGALGRDVTSVIGFDIATTANTAYAAVNETSGRSALVTVDLASGNATELDEIGTPGSVSSGALKALATAGQVADDRVRPKVVVDFPTVLSRTARRLRGGVSCSESCRITIRPTVSGRRNGTAARTIRGGAGRASFAIGLRRPVAARVRRTRGRDRVVLRITVRDAAGNTTRVTKRALI